MTTSATSQKQKTDTCRAKDDAVPSSPAASPTSPSSSTPRNGAPSISPSATTDATSSASLPKVKSRPGMLPEIEHVSTTAMWLRCAITAWVAFLVFFFGTFSLFFELLGHAVYFLLTPWHSKKMEQYFQNYLSFCMRGGSFCAITLNPFWRLKIIRPPPENYTPGRTLVMCNHLSGGDPFMLNTCLFPWPLKYVYKHSLRTVPILGQALWLCGDIPIFFTKEKGGWGTRPGSIKMMFQRCRELLDLNIGIVIFPEGTRSYIKRLQPFKDGFFKFAVEQNCEIFPVVLHNTGHIFPQNNLADIGTAYCMMGEPIKPETFDSLVEGRKSGDPPPTVDEKVEALKLAVRKQMLALLPMSPLFDPEIERPLDAPLEQRGAVQW